MTINRASRRKFFGAVTAASLAAGVVACASTSSESVQTVIAKIVAYAQGGLSSLQATATAFGVNTTANVQTALNAASVAIAGLANAAQTGASAVAALATNPTNSVEALLTAAANLVLGVLKVIPGTSSAVGVVQDVLAVAPVITALANSILNPTAVSAPAYDGGAALRLGIRV